MLNRLRTPEPVIFSGNTHAFRHFGFRHFCIMGIASANAGYVKFGHGSTQHVRAGFRLGSHNDMTFGEGTSSRDTLRDSTKHRVSELPVNWWVQPSVIRTFSSRGDMSMGTAAAGSNMTFSPSRNGTSLDLQAGLEARVRENITLGVQAGYAHSVSGSSAEGYNGQATLNVTF